MAVSMGSDPFLSTPCYHGATSTGLKPARLTAVTANGQPLPAHDPGDDRSMDPNQETVHGIPGFRQDRAANERLGGSSLLE